MSDDLSKAECSAEAMAIARFAKETIYVFDDDLKRIAARIDDFAAQTAQTAQDDRAELIAAAQALLNADGRWHDYIDMAVVDRLAAALATSDDDTLKGAAHIEGWK